MEIIYLENTKLYAAWPAPPPPLMHNLDGEKNANSNNVTVLFRLLNLTALLLLLLLFHFHFIITYTVCTYSLFNFASFFPLPFSSQFDLFFSPYFFFVCFQFIFFGRVFFFASSSSLELLLLLSYIRMIRIGLSVCVKRLSLVTNGFSN